jgi:hypothetical protein
MWPAPRPVRQPVKIAAIVVFAIAMALGIVHEIELGGLLLLTSFILIFFI